MGTEEHPGLIEDPEREQLDDGVEVSGVLLAGDGWAGDAVCRPGIRYWEPAPLAGEVLFLTPSDARRPRMLLQPLSLCPIREVERFPLHLLLRGQRLGDLRRSTGPDALQLDRRRLPNGHCVVAVLGRGGLWDAYRDHFDYCSDTLSERANECWGF